MPSDSAVSVLVVDDEPDMRELIRVNLEAQGYQVTAVPDGETALRAVAAERPDVVFLDILMPGVDGWSVLASLKSADDSIATVPVVMVTALSGTEDRLRGAIEGAVHYLTKPFHPRELIQVLESLLAPDAPPEIELRRRARQEALERLARIEAGGDAVRREPRVRLTRLELSPVREMPPARVTEAQRRMSSLTEKQLSMLRIIRDAGGSVTAAAEQLGTSRSNVYASLRRIVHRLELRDTTELLRLLVAGDLME